MAFIVEDGTNVANANSYETVAALNTYWKDRGRSSTFLASTNSLKESALILATDYVDSTFINRWKGLRTNDSQVLAWPRKGVVDQDGVTLDDDLIPSALKNSVFELADAHLAGVDIQPDITNPGQITRTKVKVGSIVDEVAYEAGGAGQTPAFNKAEALLRGLVVSSAELVRG